MKSNAFRAIKHSPTPVLSYIIAHNPISGCFWKPIQDIQTCGYGWFLVQPPLQRTYKKIWAVCLIRKWVPVFFPWPLHVWAQVYLNGARSYRIGIMGLFYCLILEVTGFPPLCHYVHWYGSVYPCTQTKELLKRIDGQMMYLWNHTRRTLSLANPPEYDNTQGCCIS